jgi:hypothetical protein
LERVKFIVSLPTWNRDILNECALPPGIVIDRDWMLSGKLKERLENKAGLKECVEKERNG